MAFMQLAQAYQSGQNANPFGAFVAGEQQANQLQLEQQRQQANQLALLQAQQQSDQANQLDQLAPSVYTTTDPTQRAQLQSKLAGLGTAGRAEATDAGTAWANQTKAAKTRLLDGATRAAQLAFSAQSIQDPNQQAAVLAQARQAIAASGADPKAVASLEAMDPQTQMRVIENGAMTMKQLADRGVPDLSKPIDVFASDGTTHQMVNVNGRLVPIDQYIGQGATGPALDANGAATPALVGAVKRVESNGNPNAVSPAGAVGVMQVMPATASSVGFPNADLRNPQVNQAIGTQYLNQQIQKYHDPSLALAAYNAGPGTVDKLIAQYGNSYAAIAPHLPQETQAYVPKVLGQLNAGPVNVAPPAAVPATPVAPAPASPAQQGVQAALGNALHVMAQPVGSQQPQPQQAPTGQPATPEQQVGVNMKLLALQQQRGVMTLPQIMQATNASPQLAQAVTALSGLNPTVGLDMNDPVILNRIGMAMTKAAQQAPHLMPANVTSVAQAAPQPVAQPTAAPAPVAPPVPQAPVQFGVKPAAGTTKGDVIAQRAQQLAELKARGVQFTPQQEQTYLTTGKGDTGSSNDVEAPPPADPKLQGQAYLDALPENIRSQAVLMASGKTPLPTGYALRIGFNQQALMAAQHINPNLDAGSYAARAAMQKDATSGKLGTAFNSINAASAHMEQMAGLIQHMDVSGLGPVGWAELKGKSFINDPTLRAYQAIVPQVASEMATVYKPTNTSDAEIKAFSDTFDASHGKTALIGALQNQAVLMYSKALQYQRQYERGMRAAGLPFEPVSPEAQQAMQNLQTAAQSLGIPQDVLMKKAAQLSGINDQTPPTLSNPAPIQTRGTPQAAPQSAAGPIAVNPQTGERMQLVNGQWVKL